ncbi:MAG: carboxypeptidase-like regulatory domain-containing protein [Sandaracinaceae bacterium]|nr:carboxypeptidase-like regulatory domain-containing protein [Sandaracinaceae bacterium]
MAHRLVVWCDPVPAGWRRVDWPGSERALASLSPEHVLDAIARAGAPWEPYWDETPVLIDVARRLILRGELELYTDDPELELLPLTPGTQPGKGGGDDPPVEPPVEPPEDGEWIELVVKDQNGQPVPNVRYEVTLPDGQLRTGRLDALGFARLDGIPGGNCKVRFPELPADGTRHL